MLTGLALLLSAVVATGPEALDAGDEAALVGSWTLGEWTGVRKAGGEGAGDEMTLRCEPILGGLGEIRHIEIRHDGGTYRGLAVQVFSPELGRWVRQYVNATRGRFARLEGEVRSDGSVFRSASPDRARESRVVSDRPTADSWRRTMSVSEDGGATWRVLWVDELRRTGEREGDSDSRQPPGSR